MKSQVQQLKNLIDHKSFWVFATLGSLATLDFYSVWKISAKTPTLINFLCWGGIFFLLWEKRDAIKFRGNLISSAIGITLVSWMVARHIITQPHSTISLIDVVSRLFPLVILIGILLISSGFKRLKYYKAEILISTATAISAMSDLAIRSPIALIDAQISAFMLHYVGFKVLRNDYIISLSNASVDVFNPCSSLIPFVTMFPIAVVFVATYSASKTTKIYVCIAAILSTFFINAIRICLLAILSNNGETASFDYWHTGEGAGIFSNLIIFLIAGISYQMLNYFSKQKQEV